MRVVGKDAHILGKQILTCLDQAVEVAIDENGTAHIPVAHRTGGHVDEAKVDCQVARCIVAVHRSVWLAAVGNRHHIGCHVAAAAQQAVARAMADRVAVGVAVHCGEPQRFAGQFVVQSTAHGEVRVGNHHKQIARYFADKLILAAAVAGGAQDKPVGAGCKDVVLVSIDIKFNGHIGDTRFAAIQEAIVVGILPDLVPNGEGSKRKAEVEGAVVGTSVTDTESDHARICAVHNLGDAVAVTRVAVG